MVDVDDVEEVDVDEVVLVKLARFFGSCNDRLLFGIATVDAEVAAKSAGAAVDFFFFFFFVVSFVVVVVDLDLFSCT